MEENRIQELQDFVSEFQDQLKEAKELYEEKQAKSKTIEAKSVDGKKKFRIYKLKKIEKINLNNEHWSPNCLFGKSFERFKKLTNGHFPTSWELVNKNKK